MGPWSKGCGLGFQGTFRGPMPPARAFGRESLAKIGSPPAAPLLIMPLPLLIMLNTTYRIAGKVVQ